MRISATFACIGLVAGATTLLAQDPIDFGMEVQQMLQNRSQQLFGVGQPITQSAQGPYTGSNSADAVLTARGLRVSVVSNATNPLADQIALWPSDENPTHLIMAIESGTTAPAVQIVTLNGDPNTNVKTILIGLNGGDPIRRTPWGTILVGEEESDGGAYEIFDPLGITTAVQVVNRATGQTSDPAHVVKRKALGALAYEGIAILPDGTMYYGDELRPSSGVAGGSIYKFVSNQPYSGGAPITDPTLSPFATGKIYGMRVGDSDYGQGTEIGKGTWVAADAAAYTDANGNINLRAFAAASKLTGYYRPEDMDLDEKALSTGKVKMCWTNTGRMSNGGNSVVETGAIYGEVVCMEDNNNVPFVTRFYAGGPDANYFDNLDFQPKTGNMVVLEDGEVEVVLPDGSTELRGNDLWMLLPDGADRDVQSDGAIKIMSLKDTSSEPTGFIFDATGETAYVNLQHRSTNLGAVLKITGFKTGN